MPDGSTFVDTVSPIIDATAVPRDNPAMPLEVPESVRRVAELDPRLGEEVASLFRRLMLAGEAVVWAQGALADLATAGGPDQALRVVVDRAGTLTNAPVVWALRWRGTFERGISYEALAASQEAQEVPAPADVSSSILGQVATTGTPAWTDDAAADARFAQSQSVVAHTLRSVGCLPLGPSAVLYVADPTRAGRFDAQTRARLGALCALAGPFLTPSNPQRRRVVEPLPGLVGEAPAMVELAEAVRAFSPLPWPVLVLGPTGAGKEGVARAIHALSPRSHLPFVAINCGAIPENLAESTLFGHERGAFTGADRAQEGQLEHVGEGTLFLDEVGELPPPIQVKLLRLLQEGTYQRLGSQRTLRFAGRVVAATHRDLEDPVGRGTFREDLYFRLAATVVRVPPLDARRSDIPALAERLLQNAKRELAVGADLQWSASALGALQQRSWPGNVRELQNVVRHGVARALASRVTVIAEDHLGLAPRPVAPTDGSLQAATEAFQRAKVYEAIEQAGGNRTEAAQLLGVSRQWLHRLLARWES